MSKIFVTHKECRKCKITKPVNKFYKDKRKKDGLRSWCKQCEIDYVSDYQKTPAGKAVHKRYARSEKGRARMRKFDRSEKGRKKHSRYNCSPKGRAYNRLSRQRHPNRAKARDAVNNAVKANRIPPVCTFKCHLSGCTTLAQEYHHYLGYEPEHWLDVKPICIKHHRELEPRQ